ncbi:MAG: TetR/AcrR family transcriptional regulator [Desulfovibrionaceae bacterium]|nr:TetR/AcrR family transcriptional regulator [Desulfovibrionaceae bacterium]
MGRKKTPERDALATKEKIVEAAERLFREIGYAKTTVADIAASLGMSPANIYRYFPTKAHINEEICDRLVRGIEARCIGSMGRDGTFQERITSLLMAYHISIRESIFKENRMSDMIAIAMEQHWPVIQSHSERIRNMLLSLLDQGVAAGEFRDSDTYKMARALHETIAIFIHPPLLEHWVNEFSDAGPGDSVEEQFLFLLDMVFCGVCVNTR